MKNSILIIGILCTLELHVQSQKLIIPVSRNEKWGAIDQKGKWLIEPSYLAMKEFFNGVALAKSETGWKYVNA